MHVQFDDALIRGATHLVLTLLTVDADIAVGGHVSQEAAQEAGEVMTEKQCRPGSLVVPFMWAVTQAHRAVPGRRFE